MLSADAFSESRPPLKAHGSSPAAPAPDGAGKTTTEAIHLAVTQCITQQPGAMDALGHAVRGARADGVKAEHVVLLIHDAWDRHAGTASSEHDMKRLRLTGVALDAYFADV